MFDDSGFAVDPDNAFQRAASSALTTYLWAIESGVAPEQARMILPQNMQTEWIWTG